METLGVRPPKILFCLNPSGRTIKQQFQFIFPLGHLFSSILKHQNFKSILEVYIKGGIGDKKNLGAPTTKYLFIFYSLV